MPYFDKFDKFDVPIDNIYKNKSEEINKKESGKLSDVEMSRLLLLMEDLFNVNRSINNIIKLGYEHKENESNCFTNRNILEEDCAHLISLIERMSELKDMDGEKIKFFLEKNRKS